METNLTNSLQTEDDYSFLSRTQGNIFESCYIFKCKFDSFREMFDCHQTFRHICFVILVTILPNLWFVKSHNFGHHL